MNFRKSVIRFFLFVVVYTNMNAQSIEPSKKILYKEINNDSLYLHVFKTEKIEKPTAVVVFFFGGGWVGGTPKQFYQQSEYFASRGVLAIAAEYRIKKKHGTTPFDAVEDAKSAIRWVREHAKELNINPKKIISAGGSAGGHIAICTALIDGHENVNENLKISSVPNAIVAYNPVLDTTKKGYGAEKVIGRETEISPCHQVKKDMPPVLVFHGTKDKTVPFENAERFQNLMKLANNSCELISFEGEGHGFFNGSFFRKGNNNKNFNSTMYDTDMFLKKMCFVKGKPTIEKK